MVGGGFSHHSVATYKSSPNLQTSFGVKKWKPPKGLMRYISINEIKIYCNYQGSNMLYIALRCVLFCFFKKEDIGSWGVCESRSLFADEF